MGYYVDLADSNAYIPTDKLDEAYEILCELNNHNDLKRGGQFPKKDIEGPHEGIWFSWLDWNYPELFDSAQKVLEAVGYELITYDYGLRFIAYGEKTGCEDIFFAALAPVLASANEEPPSTEWRGEDGALWRIVILDGKAVFQEARVTYVS
jgi:hypothetical protein